MAQVLNQFIKKLQSNILRSIRPHHPTSLQDAITLAHNFESAEQEANHTQAINLAINRTFDINAKITQLIGNNWLSKVNATLDWNTQELQLTFNGQHVQVPVTCGHFKIQRTEEPLIELEDTSLPPTIETYQVHVSGTTKNGPPPPNIIADLVYWKNLDDQNDKASRTTCHVLHVVKFYQMKDSGMMCLTEEEHAMRLAEGATSEEIREIKNNPWTPEYNGPDYSENDFFTNDPDTFQN
ncbi:hypothetical protein G9A89_004722 [Geosiphon pyriformis]|nr:hypothetical protein G9A89_004722 [Geosiphon pyriformis]